MHPFLKLKIEMIPQLTITLTPLGVILAILALVGVVAFFVACWKNIKK